MWSWETKVRIRLSEIYNKATRYHYLGDARTNWLTGIKNKCNDWNSWETGCHIKAVVRDNWQDVVRTTLKIRIWLK